MTEYPLVDPSWRRPNGKAAMYLRAFADEFASLSTLKANDASEEDWEAVSAALEALGDALDWIAGPR